MLNNITRIWPFGRNTGSSVGLTLLLLGSTLGFPYPGVAADWPQFLGPARNGTSSENGLVSSWRGKGPQVAWQRDIGIGFGGPVVAGSRLILFHRVGDQEVVECWEAATGKAVWKN